MRKNLNVIAAYSIMMGLIILVGIFQSWNIALSIFNLCLISAVMTMGANIQWGYAGLINFGIMGYTALGGLAAVLISVDPVQEAWSAGGFNILLSLLLIIGMVLAVRYVLKKYEKSKIRTYIISTIIISGIIKGKSIAPYDKPLYLTLYLVKAFAANKAIKVLIIEAITTTLILFHNA